MALTNPNIPPRSSTLQHTLLWCWVVLVMLCSAGCKGVEPWQRENLASYGMRPDRDPLARHLQEHMWFSREAANGGGRVGGGGCGCN
jgi:hypothetical protein